MIRETNADLLLLSRFDQDYQNLALTAFAALIAQSGGPYYPHLLSAPQNRGLIAPLDLDGDGRAGGPGDLHGWGRFSGDGALALLSRYPLRLAEDHSASLWQDLPDHSGGAGAGRGQRLSSSGHWVVELDHPRAGPLLLLIHGAGHARFTGAPRNHDETVFWRHWLHRRDPQQRAAHLIYIGHPAREAGDTTGLIGPPFQTGCEIPGSVAILPAAPLETAQCREGAEDLPKTRFSARILIAEIPLKLR